MSPFAVQMLLAFCGFLGLLAVAIGSASLGFAFTVSRKVATLEMQMSVVWPQVKFVTAMGLHSPDDHQGIDGLLVKWAKGTIDNEELARLIRAARDIEANAHTDEEKLKVQGLLRMINVEYQLN